MGRGQVAQQMSQPDKNAPNFAQSPCAQPSCGSPAKDRDQAADMAASLKQIIALSLWLISAFMTLLL